MAITWSPNNSKNNYVTTSLTSNLHNNNYSILNTGNKNISNLHFHNESKFVKINNLKSSKDVPDYKKTPIGHNRMKKFTISVISILLIIMVIFSIYNILPKKITRKFMFIKGKSTKTNISKNKQIKITSSKKKISSKKRNKR